MDNEEVVAKGALVSFEKHAPLALMIIFLAVSTWLISNQIELGKSLVAIQTQLVSLQHQLDAMDLTRYTTVDADKDKQIMNGQIDALAQRVTNLEKQSTPVRR